MIISLYDRYIKLDIHKPVNKNDMQLLHIGHNWETLQEENEYRGTQARFEREKNITPKLFCVDATLQKKVG